METHSKIPPEAKRVFKGVVFDVYQWSVKRFDGSMGTWEMLKRPDTAVIFPVTDAGNIVVTDMVQPGRRMYGCPGGHIEQGEKPVDAAKRELLEETGYIADEFVPWFTNVPFSKCDYTCHFFVARGSKKIQEPKDDPGEKTIVSEVPFDDFFEMNLDGRMHFNEIENIFLRAKLDAKKMEKLRKLFLG